MSYVILDLEWNAAYSKPIKRYINEIIEFGAVKTDDNFNIIDRFSILVKPQISKNLSSKVKELTKLSIDELKNSGTAFLDAALKFSKFINGSAMFTWGTSDIHVLIDNFRYYTDNEVIPFLSQYCNIQEYCENCLDFSDCSSQLGLTACADMLGISFSEYEQHRAFKDAELSLKCLKYFVSDYPVEPFIVNAKCREFYDKMLFKSHYITSLLNPEVDKKQLRFVCDECGKPARKTSKWKLHNKSFIADFYCKSCGKKFLGRASFKKKYDSVAVHKAIVEKKTEDEKENLQSSEDHK